jgi:NhaP-type Na+/H+ or K+/H+ antiporter
VLFGLALAAGLAPLRRRSAGWFAWAGPLFGGAIYLVDIQVLAGNVTRTSRPSTALLRLPLLGSEPKLQPLGPVALAIVLYGLCHYTHANAYLAAFSAGITLATVAPHPSQAFAEFGELVSELTKFAAVLVFGALLTPDFFVGTTIGEWVVAVLAIVLVRPLAVLVALWRADLSRRERYAAAWFGPKGFASVVYGLLVVQSGIPATGTVFELVAVTIALSMIAHSMTDVPVSKAFHVEAIAGLPAHDAPAGSDRPRGA